MVGVVLADVCCVFIECALLLVCVALCLNERVAHALIIISSDFEIQSHSINSDTS